MRYILNSDGYIMDISFGTEIECDLGTCTLYTGEIPTGYNTLEEWLDGEIDKLNAWKIVDGNLVFDPNRYETLNVIREKEEEENRHVTVKELKGLNISVNKVVNDMFKLCTTDNYSKIIDVNDSNNLSCEKIIIRANETISNYIKLMFMTSNLLPNDLLSYSNNGIYYAIKNKKAISINGIATGNSEVNLCGTETNTNSILIFKKNISYILSGLVDGVSLKFYNYDGTDRTLIGTYSNETITFNDEDKYITNVTISIPNGTNISSIIYPMLNQGTIAKPYEENKNSSLIIDLKSYSLKNGDYLIIENEKVRIFKIGLYPSDTLFPSDDLFPNGIRYFLDNVAMPSTYNSNTVLYTEKDTEIQLTYRTTEQEKIEPNRIKLEGYTTINEGFSVDLEGNMTAKNGKFTGGNLDLYDTATTFNEQASVTITNTSDTSLKGTTKMNSFGISTNRGDEEYSRFSYQGLETYLQQDEGYNSSWLSTYINSKKGSYFVPGLILNRSGVSEGSGYTLISTEGIETTGTVTASNLPTNVVAGTCTLNSSSSTSVNFGKTFSKTPIIILTPYTTTSGVIAGKVTEVTTTGFKAIIGGSVSGNITFNWIAIN